MAASSACAAWHSRELVFHSRTYSSAVRSCSLRRFSSKHVDTSLLVHLIGARATTVWWSPLRASQHEVGR